MNFSFCITYVYMENGPNIVPFYWLCFYHCSQTFRPLLSVPVSCSVCVAVNVAVCACVRVWRCCQQMFVNVVAFFFFLGLLWKIM